MTKFDPFPVSPNAGFKPGEYFALSPEELYDLDDPEVMKWWQQVSAERAERANRDRDISVAAKLADAQIPGAVVTFDPDEAERAGAFREDAMTPADADEANEGPYSEDDYLALARPANDREQEQ